jgi:hypothetical protein
MGAVAFKIVRVDRRFCRNPAFFRRRLAIQPPGKVTFIKACHRARDKLYSRGFEGRLILWVFELSDYAPDAANL